MLVTRSGVRIARTGAGGPSIRNGNLGEVRAAAAETDSLRKPSE